MALCVCDINCKIAHTCVCGETDNMNLNYLGIIKSCTVMITNQNNLIDTYLFVCVSVIICSILTAEKKSDDMPPCVYSVNEMLNKWS